MIYLKKVNFKLGLVDKTFTYNIYLSDMYFIVTRTSKPPPT